MSRIVIIGVGRSGTTALYHNLRTCFGILGETPALHYEPYLWHAEPPAPEPDFDSTGSLSPLGIAAHCGEPLFSTSAQHEITALFLRSLEAGGGPALLKFIRACGRMQILLDAWPDARVVFIFRNPASVVNSVLRLFSFFGDEFHPTDTDRFCQETGLSKPEFLAEAYAVRQLLYWRHMNAAALETARANPARVLPISQEALAADPATTMRAVCSFCFGPDDRDRLSGAFADDAGARSVPRSFRSLAIADRAAFDPHLDWYLDDLLPACRSGSRIDPDGLRTAISAAWEESRPGLAQRLRPKSRPDIPVRSANPLALRRMLPWWRKR